MRVDQSVGYSKLLLNSSHNATFDYMSGAPGRKADELTRFKFVKQQSDNPGNGAVQVSTSALHFFKSSFKISHGERVSGKTDDNKYNVNHNNMQSTVRRFYLQGGACACASMRSWVCGKVHDVCPNLPQDCCIRRMARMLSTIDLSYMCIAYGFLHARVPPFFTWTMTRFNARR